MTCRTASGPTSRVFILVAGPPGAGKSTVARPVAEGLGLALLVKDAIKDALIEQLGVPASVQESRELGRAAVMAMLAIARTSPGAVLDSTFYPYTVSHLQELPGQLIEIRCTCPRELVEARYRARSASRSAGYFDAERPSEELWNEHHLAPLGLGPLIEVDTSTPVDIPALLHRLRGLMDRR
jgi:predicted kinase